MLLTGTRLILAWILIALCAGPSVASSSPDSPASTGNGETLSSPAQALQAYQARAMRQLTTLAASTDDTIVDAELETTSQRAEFVLKRTFSAPQSLAYTAVTFQGDTFVKNNVIVRLLQSDVDRVQKKNGLTVAIVESNYKFSFRNTEDLNGRMVYVFVLKPRRKESSLFKGKIFIDTQTDHILRATGKLSRSPSWWIKRVDFTQDYVDIGEFTMPLETRLYTQVRILGPIAIVIRHNSYQVHSTEETDCGKRVEHDDPLISNPGVPTANLRDPHLLSAGYESSPSSNWFALPEHIANRELLEADTANLASLAQTLNLGEYLSLEHPGQVQPVVRHSEVGQKTGPLGNYSRDVDQCLGMLPFI